MVYCPKCGKPFLMKSYLLAHECEEPKEEKKEETSELSRDELVELAKEAGITGAARMKKDDLIEALK